MRIVGETPCERKLCLANLVAERLTIDGFPSEVLRNVLNSQETHTDYCLVKSSIGTIHITAQGELRQNSYVELDFGKGDQSFTVDKDWFAIGYNSTDGTKRTFIFMLRAKDVVGKKRITVADMKALSDSSFNIILK